MKAYFRHIRVGSIQKVEIIEDLGNGQTLIRMKDGYYLVAEENQFCTKEDFSKASRLMRLESLRSKIDIIISDIRREVM